MHKLALITSRIPLGSLILAFGLFVGCLAGCSSNKHSASQPDAGSDAGSFDAAIVAKDAAADGSVGGVLEGDVCQAPADCAKGLSCVSSSNGSVMTGICAKPCTADTDCGTDRCYSQTGLAVDAHCVNVVREEFGTCGIGDTSICGQPLTCLYYSASSSIGLCVTICPLPMSETDAGTPDDGGVLASKDAGSAANVCAAKQACLTNIVDSTTQGVCGVPVARGAVCSLEQGLFCQDGDLCSPDDPNSQTSAVHCHEDCTSTSACSKGKCTSVRNVAYCL